MMHKTKFDDIVEQFSRRIAGGTSRRSFIGRVGTAIAGVALVPLLPVDRSGRVSRANAAGGGDMGQPGRDGWHPQVDDETRCDYWRHCSLDGYICNCNGGTITECPPGTRLSPSSWVASCYNPTDKQSYLIAYRDCCGNNIALTCPCLNTEGELPVYRPEFGNDVIWCFGAEDDAMSYHCTLSPIVGKSS